ncbi:MAG: DedA family protein, partial [Actinomycetota bacterium]
MLLASLVSFLLDRIQHLPANVVYLVVFALVFGEAALFIGFVLPGETAVLVAGAAATSGHGTNIKLLCVIVVVAAIGG